MTFVSADLARSARTEGPRTRKSLLRRVREQWWIYLFLLPTLVGYGLYTVYPLAASWVYAFMDWPGFALTGTFNGLENFVQLWNDPLFWNSFGKSLLFLVVAMPTRVVLALLLALWLNSRATPFKGVFRTLFFLPVVTTGAIIGIVFTLLLDAQGPISLALVWAGITETPMNFVANPDTSLWSGVAVWVWKWLGITMIYWLAALQTVPQDVHEAAQLDGAGPWQEFWRVTLPLLIPFLIIITLIDTVSALNVFDLMQTMTGGGPAFSSEVIEIFIYRTAFAATTPQLGYASAAAVLFGMLTVVLAIVQALGIRAARGMMPGGTS